MERQAEEDEEEVIVEKDTETTYEEEDRPEAPVTVNTILIRILVDSPASETLDEAEEESIDTEYARIAA